MDALSGRVHLNLQTYFHTFGYFAEQSADFSSSSDPKWIEAYPFLLSSFQKYLLGEKDVAETAYHAALWEEKLDAKKKKTHRSD